MATWPTKFPRAQRRSYSGKTELAIRETKFPASTKRRRVYEDAWTYLDLDFVMSDEQFTYFFSWVRYKINEGTDVISMPLLDSDDTITNIQGYIVPGTVDWKYEETVWKVSFQFRIPSFTVPLESTLDSWLAS